MGSTFRQWQNHMPGELLTTDTFLSLQFLRPLAQIVRRTRTRDQRTGDYRPLSIQPPPPLRRRKRLELDQSEAWTDKVLHSPPTASARQAIVVFSRTLSA